MKKTIRNTIIGIVAIAACTFGTEANASERGFNGGHNTLAEAKAEMCEAGKQYRRDLNGQWGVTNRMVQGEISHYAQWLAVNDKATTRELIAEGSRCSGVYVPANGVF